MRKEFARRSEAFPIDPNIHVGIPPHRLDSDDAVEYNEAANVDYSEDEDEFVDSCLRAITMDGSAFGNWLRSSRWGAMGFSDWQMGLAVFYRLGPLRDDDGTVHQTTVEDLLSGGLAIVRTASLSEAQIALLRRVGRNHIIVKSHFHESLLDVHTEDPLPYF